MFIILKNIAIFGLDLATFGLQYLYGFKNWRKLISLKFSILHFRKSIAAFLSISLTSKVLF